MLGPQPVPIPALSPAEFRDLVEREEMLRVILDLTADTITRFDRELRYDFVNDRVIALTGTRRERWMGRTQTEMGFAPEAAEQREDRIRQVFATGEPAVYDDEIPAGTSSVWFESQLLPQFGADGSVAHVIIVSRDITPRKTAEQALVSAAIRDPLTGLANRVAVVTELEQAIASDLESDQMTAVLLVDLDHFKHVNDSLGHAVGDQLLGRAAQRLTEAVRDGDLVARLGGDEFVVVMRDLDDPAQAVHVALRVVEEFRKPLVSGATELSTTASVGISLTASTRTGIDATDLLREADTAMYVAKNAGRDGISVFDQQLRKVVDERLRVENELRGALARAELVVWYQPEIDLDDGSVCAVEALLRWRHPSGEIYPAARFIDVAADTGLIVEIGAWVLAEVCAQAAKWSESGVLIRMNLAPRQLDDANLLHLIDTATASVGLDPSFLCVEITETALLHDTTTVQCNLQGLTERGIAVALDDFGTGYASLTYLRRYHIDVVKVDRSFVTNIATSDRDQRLTAAVVSLAHHLGITVTAEGVEDADQARIVRELGCSGAQGYLYSPAVPPDEIDLMLGSNFKV